MIGSYDTAGVEWDVAVSGNYAYLAAETAGLVVLDVSTPSAPFVVDTYNTPDNAATGVAISGTNAFVCDGSSLQVLSISNPTNLIPVGSCTGDTFYWITIEDTVAYVSAYGNGVYLIDISNPLSPNILSQCTVPDTTPGYENYRAMVARVSDSTLYVAGRIMGLIAFDVSNLSNPSLLDILPTHDALDVKLAGPYAFVADGGWGAGVKIVDVSDPSSMKQIGQASTPGVAECVERVGEYLYVADWARGLSVLKVRFPQEPSIVGSAPSSGRGTDVVIRDGYAFVADEAAGLQVIDVSIPDAPHVVGTSSTAFEGASLAISGCYVYIGTNDANGTFYVVDISNAAYPKIVGSCPENWGCNGVAVSGAYAYAAGWSNGLLVIDVSIPSAPQIVGRCVPDELLTKAAKDVAVNGSHAYVAYETALVVIDISNPSFPTFVASYQSLGDAFGVSVSGSYVYIADTDYGLRIIDVSDPRSPALAGEYPIGGGAINVAVSGPYAFVRGWNQLYVFDVRDVIDGQDPKVPVLRSTLDMPLGGGRGIGVSGTYVYTAGDTLQVIDLGD